MSESYLATQQDTRSFGDLITNLLDDLNRPDLQAQAIRYAQDAMRIMQRKPFFFLESDNTVVPQYANNTNYPQGSCIQASVSGTIYIFCALQAGIGLSAAIGTPVWPVTIFTVPSSPAIPPPAPGTPGTVVDNTVFWANIGAIQPGIYTQLSTVYGVNQYIPPIDYVSPSIVEVTWSLNIRKALDKISYQELRSYDVIRPTPPTSYPTMWAYFQQQIYMWPYPVSFYPITLSYRAAPQLAKLTTDSNFWTTIAERLIRKYAQASIERELLYDQSAAQISMSAATEEMNALRSQGIQVQNAGNAGIPASSW